MYKLLLLNRVVNVDTFQYVLFFRKFGVKVYQLKRRFKTAVGRYNSLFVLFYLIYFLFTFMFVFYLCFMFTVPCIALGKLFFEKSAI